LKWITLEDIVLIHWHVIRQTGGAHGIMNPGGLESAVARPFTGYGGKTLFPDLFAKAAALIHAIISFHPFVDGNKRTALVAADVSLRLNGYRMVPSEQVEPVFWAIARGEKDIEQITDWLKMHTEPWTEKGQEP